MNATRRPFLVRSGFTLIEVLVAFVVISVVLVLVLTQINSASTSARTSGSSVEVRNAYKVANAFYTDNDASFDSSATLRDFLAGQGFADVQTMTAASGAPAAAGLGVYVYNSGASVYLSYRTADGRMWWYRDNDGSVAHGSGPAVPPPVPILLISTGFSAGVSLITPDGATTTALGGTNVRWARLLPGGQQVVYTNATGDFYKVNADGSGHQLLHSPSGNGTYTTFYAAQRYFDVYADEDGSNAKIVFSAAVPNATGSRWGIYAVDVATGTRTTIITPPGAGTQYNHEPVFNADGTRVAFVRYNGTQWDLMATNADGSGGTSALTNDASLESRPLWSGANIVYTVSSAAYSKPQTAAPGDAPTALTIPGGSSTRTMSPDGTRFINHGNSSFSVRNATTGAMIGVGRSCPVGNLRTADWNEDGTRVVFACGAGMASAIHVANADGSGAITNLGSAGAALWQGDQQSNGPF